MVDRLFVNQKKYEELDLSLLCEDHMYQFLFFMALGFKENNRKKQEESNKDNNSSKKAKNKGDSKKKIMIIEYRLKEEHKALLTTLALNECNKEYFEKKNENSEEGTFKMISFEENKEYIYKIAEEYAEGGMESYKKLCDNAPLDDKHLVEKEIKRYLNKLNLE